MITTTSSGPAAAGAEAAVVIRIRAHRFAHDGPPGFEAPDHKGDFDEHVRTYQVAGPAEALAQFAASFPEMLPVLHEWHLESFIPSALPRPQRCPLNWSTHHAPPLSHGC